MGLFLVILLFSLKATLLSFGIFFVAPFFLAAVAWLRSIVKPTDWHHRARSALYAGRVWHTRYLPIRHAFEYPLFLFCLDLAEIESEQIFEDKLWPLSLIMKFSDSDHLKNGEGLPVTAQETETSNNTSIESKSNSPLSSRILYLVAQKTKGNFEPTLKTHGVWIITHLSYYGYCFNPVSFYYVQNKSTNRTDAVVGEVSNTPWNEMHVYVLHEKSVDDVSVSVNVLPERENKQEDDSSRTLLNFVFPKAFHVSPFMEMEYKYDWTFSETFFTTGNSNNNELQIINDMRRNDDDALAFRARMQVKRTSLHPFRAAWHLASFPVYCLIIQIWIHYQAFWLFCKGVAFQPHPEGSETAASRMIGAIMVPFFALKDVLSGVAKKKKES